MSLNAWPFVDMLQRVAGPVVQALGAVARDPRGSVLICTDRRDSFLGLALRCCAAGAAGRLQVVNTRDVSSGVALATVDGLTIGSPRAALIGRHSAAPGQTWSLDRHAEQGGRVLAIALDGAAMAARAWRGALDTIARDRPIFMAYARGQHDSLAELAAHDYVVQDIDYWAAPEAGPLIALAIPRELAQAGGAPALIAPPADLKTSFLPHDFEVETGFYSPETGEHGQTWIWSGSAKEARIVLPTPWCGQGRVRVHLLASDHVTTDPGGIELRINNRTVPLTIEGLTLSAPVPIDIEDFSGGHTLSILTRDLVACPYGSGRWLGCCVSHVALEWF